MLYTEVEATLKKFVSEPDSAPAEIPAFLEALKGDYEIAESSAKKVSELEEKVRTLQDTNTKLFLMQTGGSAELDEPEELEGTAAVDAFVKELMEKGDK